MRTETPTRILYTFEELTSEAQEKAVDNLYDINVLCEWWDSIYDHAANVWLEIESFDIDRGSYCKGRLTRGINEVCRLILENHSPDSDTYKLAQTWIAGKRTGDNDSNDFERALCEEYRIMLQHEYEYLTSQKAIIETIQANEYEFTENGDRS